MTNGSVIARGRLLSMADRPVRDGTVIVEGGIVVYAGSTARAPRITGSVVELDVGDGTIMPGLIDAHVHLVASGGPYIGSDFDPDRADMLVIQSLINMRSNLKAGVTTVRDLAAPGLTSVHLRKLVESGEVDGPHIAAAGTALTLPEGHLALLSKQVEGVDAVASAARELASAGVDGLTLIVTGQITEDGEGHRVAESFTTEELEAAASVAAEAGVWVAAHALDADGVVRSLTCGARSIERGTLLDERGAQLMAAKGAWLVPTRGWVLANTPELADKHAHAMRLAVEAGVPIALGTDGGASNMPHGMAALEAKLLVDTGVLDDAKALEAATIAGAELLGRDDLGRLAPGTVGDLVVVDDDPLDGVQALNDIRTVVRQGRILQHLGGAASPAASTSP